MKLCEAEDNSIGPWLLDGVISEYHKDNRGTLDIGYACEYLKDNRGTLDIGYTCGYHKDNRRTLDIGYACGYHKDNRIGPWISALSRHCSVTTTDTLDCHQAVTL